MCLPFHHAGGAVHNSDPGREEKRQRSLFGQDIALIVPVSEQATVILDWHPFGNSHTKGCRYVVLFRFGPDAGRVSGDLCRDLWLGALPCIPPQSSLPRKKVVRI
jgi:hypothetical protein